MKSILIAGAIAALAASASIAQTGPNPQTVPYAQPPQQQFGYGQRDAVQTRNEVMQRVRDRFARMDANRDGFLTREESQAAAAQLRGQRVAMRAQRQADPARRAERQAQAFDRLDLDRNGVITRDEFPRAQAMRGERIGRGQRMGQGAGMAGARSLRGALAGRMFETADVNRDNRVSMQEATEAALRHFDMADANRDGRVTREERQQVRQRMMQNRGRRG